MSRRLDGAGQERRRRLGGRRERAMSDRLLRAYPPAWRERYGRELLSLLEADSENGRISWRVKFDVIGAGLVQRLRSCGLAGDEVPPEGRIRAGVLLVLSSWAVFVVVGLAFAKTAEHWQAVTPRPDRGVPAAAYDGMLLAAELGTLAVLLGIALTARPLLAFLRAGGWTKIHGPVLRAIASTGLTFAVFSGVVAWAHHLTNAQRNGGDWHYGVAFLVVVLGGHRFDRVVDTGCGRDRASTAAVPWVIAAGDVPGRGDDRDDGGDDGLVDGLVDVGPRLGTGVRRRHRAAVAHARHDVRDGRCHSARGCGHVPLSARPARVSVAVVFETHSTSVDNELGIATGWNQGALSEAGREQARRLGERRRDDGISAVFTSDLRRAVETAEIAFAGSSLPVVPDPRLRECNYGTLNGMPRARLEAERELRLDEPFPGGESWRQAVERVAGFLRELPQSHDGERVLVIGHIATRWALEELARGVPLATLAETPFVWREGWEYTLE